MGITVINRDYGDAICTVRMITTDSIATVLTAGYLALPATITAMNAANSGTFTWLTNDLVLIQANGVLFHATLAADFSGFVLYYENSSTNGITAFAGGGQTSATQLSSKVNRITTVATAADSVKLPPAVPNRVITVINADAADAMAVFPYLGDAINALSANASLSVAANKTITFTCAVAGIWNSNLTA